LGHLGQDRHRPDRATAESLTLVGLQIEDAPEWMATLAEEGAAAGGQPALVRRRMGAGVALLADHAQDGAAAGDGEASRLLDRRGVDPVLRVAKAHLCGAAGFDQSVGGGERRPEHLRARRRRIPEEPGEGLLDDDVLPGPRSLEAE